MYLYSAIRSVTSEALGPGSVLLRRGKRESLGEEECLKPGLKHSNRVTIHCH